MWDDGSEKERVAMTPSEILKALSQGHERWPGEALSHLAFLLLFTYLTAGLGFNRFNDLGSR
jgi:hypothetical protein